MCDLRFVADLAVQLRAINLGKYMRRPMAISAETSGQKEKELIVLAASFMESNLPRICAQHDEEVKELKRRLKIVCEATVLKPANHLVLIAKGGEEVHIDETTAIASSEYFATALSSELMESGVLPWLGANIFCLMACLPAYRSTPCYLHLLAQLSNVSVWLNFSLFSVRCLHVRAVCICAHQI